MASDNAGIVTPILFSDYPNDVKRCNKCKEVRPITEFRHIYKDKEQRRSICRRCRNVYEVERDKVHKRKYRYYDRHDWWLRSKYKLTKAQYEEMLNQHQSCCWICGEKPTERRLSVDHDHKTGLVRGLLCIRCNAMIGWIESSPPGALANALKYLSEHSTSLG